MGGSGDWRRSKYCGTNACVEVDTEGDTVRVRNSKTKHWDIAFDREEWRVFVAGVKDGEFDV